MSLERIVRPFQTRDVTPPRRVVDVAQSQDPAGVVLTIGKGGSGNVMHGSISYSMTIYMDTKLKEDIKGSGASGHAINDALFSNPGAVVKFV